MIKRMLIMLAVVGVVLGGIFGFQAFVAGKIQEAMAAMGNQPQTVSAIEATVSDWQPRLEAVGTLRAERGAELAFDVPGIVAEIDFNSGDDIEQGKVLLRLQDDDDTARLKSLQAQAELARTTFDRNSSLRRSNTVSQSALDAAEADLRNIEALVTQQQAILAKKTLRAPFTGRIGLRRVDLGQYLAAGTPVATLQALDEIYADFHVPQQALARIAVGQSVAVKVDAWPEASFDGKITAIDPRVDPATRNVMVRATLANPDRKLLPGMFVTIAAATGKPEQHVTLPQTAITYNPYGNLVYVVEKQGGDGGERLTVRQTFVTLGATRGDQVAVLQGVEAGQTVVTSGQMKLRNGVPVVINNTVQPTNDPRPQALAP